MTSSRMFSAGALLAAALSLAACAAPPPPPPPAPPPAPIVGPQTMSERSVLTLAADQTFASGGYHLTRAGRARLKAIIPALKAIKNGKIVVYGYTDNRPVGPRLKRRGIVDNLDLSSKRANEVIRYLTSEGIDPSIMSGKGRGDTHPVASNDTPHGRAENRRVEVVVEQPAA